MPSTLIAGAGYVGEPLADALHAAGHKITALTGSAETATALAARAPYQAHPCDLSSAASIDALTGHFDHIVHCASSGRGGADAYRRVYLDGSRHLLRRFPDAHLLFTSSTSVYPQTQGETVTEESDATPDRETGKILRETEDLVIQSGGTVARLAGIYGPGRSFLTKRFLQEESTIDGTTPDAEGRIINQVHRDDIVSAVRFLLEIPGTFNVCDSSPIRQRAIYEILAAHFKKPLPPVAPPDTNRKRGWTDKAVSNSKLLSLGWKPRYPDFATALTSDPEFVPSILAQVG